MNDQVDCVTARPGAEPRGAGAQGTEGATRLAGGSGEDEDVVDLFDEESELATERELAWMWLADLEERVAWLEDLLGVSPGLMGINERVAWLEEVAEFLPELHKLAEMARVQRQHRSLL